MCGKDAGPTTRSTTHSSSGSRSELAAITHHSDFLAAVLVVLFRDVCHKRRYLSEREEFRVQRHLHNLLLSLVRPSSSHQNISRSSFACNKVSISSVSPPRTLFSQFSTTGVGGCSIKIKVTTHMQSPSYLLQLTETTQVRKIELIIRQIR